jgi:succinate-semialdehyde dehydrogenase/glutarate-semialdehyde dehydrogenase
MPWNFPFYQAIRFAIPALMAGNTGVLKHASNVQGCALLSKTLSLKQVFQRHVMNLNVDSKDVKNLSKIKYCHYTYGKRRCWSFHSFNCRAKLKETVMELGGSDAYIILDDVDLEKTTDLATWDDYKTTDKLVCSQTIYVHDL